LIPSLRLPLECLALAAVYGFVSYYAWPLSRGNHPFGSAFWSRTGGSTSFLILYVLIGMLLLHALYLALGPTGSFARVGLHLLAMALGSGVALALDIKSVGFAIYTYPFIWGAALLSALAGFAVAYFRNGA
jgi:hypothetical protein